MNFDGLDDDLDIGYTPTIVTNSRSAGMKKLSKKPEPKPTPVSTKKQDDFDLLDQLLASPAKIPPSKPNIQKNKSTTITNPKDNNDIDKFFDQPSIPAQSKNTINTEKSDTFRPSTAKPTISTPAEDIIVQQTDSKALGFKFKRPETALNVPKKQEDEPQITISPSLRMMKPPLRKRQSKQETIKKEQLPKTTGGIGLGLTLPQQPVKTGLSQSQEDNKFKMPMNSKRRSSIQMSTFQLNIHNADEINSKNQNTQSNGRTTSINLASNNQSKNNLFSSFDIDKSKERKQQGLGLKLQIKPQQKNQIKRAAWEPSKSIMINESNSTPYKNQDFQNNSFKKQQVSNDEMQKQLDFVKKNYQKHVDLLQKNLQDQIKTNKESRDRLMKEANEMIENQRSRMKKIHSQQIERIKQMGEWEKKKLQENYKGQIQSLKHQVEKLNQLIEKPKQSAFSTYSNKKQIEYLQEKIKSERKMLEEKSKLLDKRQLDLQQREKDFNKRKRFQEEKLRNQQKRILQYQMDSKKQLLNQRRQIQDQKQSIASQFANLQLGNYKKMQNIQHLKSQILRQKQEINRQRTEMRNLNNQIMIDCQKKNEQLKIQKQKVARLESQLVGKIRIVEAQATRQRLNTTNPISKQNNWVKNTSINDIKVDESTKKSMSIDKINQLKKLESTQNRFLELTANLKENLFLNRKGKQFDLDNYLMSMAHYTRGREQIH